MADDKPFTLDPDAVTANVFGEWTGGALDYAGAFVKSGAESVPELIGFTPSAETLKFRATNPIAGFLSEMAGMAVPYAGWFRAAKSIPRLVGASERAAAGVGGLESAPFLAGAAREAVIQAPFELATGTFGSVFGDKPLGEIATEKGLNLALGAGIGGGISKIASVGKRSKGLGELAPDIPLDAPPQLQLRKLDEMLGDPALPPDRLASLTNIRDNLDNIARRETTPALETYTDIAPLNKLFKVGAEGMTERKILVSSAEPHTFNTPEEVRAIEAATGLGENFTRDVQYPRVISFNKNNNFEARVKRALDPDAAVPEEASGRTLRQAKLIEKEVAKAMDPVGDGWFLTREKNDGMFVMARKFQGDIGKSTADDKWVIFKTDTPGKFVPAGQKWSNAQVALEKWRLPASNVERNLGKSDEYFGTMYDALRKIPKDNYLELSRIEGGPKGVSKFWERYGPAFAKDTELVEHAKNVVREYAAPTQRQLKKSTSGNWVLNMGRLFQDSADTLAQKILQGEHRFDPKQDSLFKMIWSGKAGAMEGRAAQAVFDEMANQPEVWKDFFHIWRNGISASEAQAMAGQRLLNSRAVELASELDSINKGLMKQLNTTEDAAGKQLTKAREGHYGLSRAWDGDVFTVIRDEGGKPVGFGAGFNKEQSRKRAAEVATKLGEESGRKHLIGETFIRDNPSGVPRDLVPFVTNPGFTMERKNLRGFKWDVGDIPTPQEFFKDYAANTYKRTTYMANLTRESLLHRDVQALATEDPFAYRVVTSRFNQMSGVPGEFSKAQNKLVDRVLAPVLGRNSATKIVQATNGALWHLQLGMGKLSYPISNMLGNLQVVAPELSFIMTAEPARLAGTYTFVPAFGTRGPTGFLGFLSPLKIMGQSLRLMRSPDKEFTAGLQRAINERIIDPRMLEEFVGQNARSISGFREALKSPGDFGKAVLELSNWIPSASERFARTHAYSTGWVAGRDVLNLKDPELIHKFAKTFTERTMYLYSSADRPLMFTSPLGSSMGLFKNWMMNYMSSMAEYAGEGLSRGNWGPLAWQTIGAGMTGGLASTPLIWGANALSKSFGDKKIEQWSYDTFNSKMADGVMYGLPAALTGVSFSSAMTVPGANPVRDAAQLFSFAAWDRAKMLGGSVGAAFDNYQATGRHPASDPDVRNQLIRAFAPVNIYRAMSLDVGEGTVKTLSTDLPQIKGMSGVDMALYAMGLQPVVLEKQLQVAQDLYADKQKHTAMTKRMGDAYFEAMKVGDSKTMQVVIENAVTLGVDVSSIMRSASAHQKLERQDVVERLSKPRDMAGYVNMLGR